MPRIPTSSCRLRLDHGETLDHAESLLPLLDAIGVTTVSLPQLLRGEPDGEGGRLIVDPTRVDPTLGGDAALRRLTASLAAAGMDAIVDVGADRLVASPTNPLFRAVLRDGRGSPFHGWFDIEWELAPDGRRERLVLPILMRPYGDALASGKVRLSLGREGFVVDAYGVTLPLCVDSWRAILGRRQAALEAAIGTGHPAIAGLRRLVMQTLDRASLSAELAGRLRDIIDEHPPLKILVDDSLAAYNDAAGPGVELLHELLEQQHYRLCWRDARELAHGSCVAADRDGCVAVRYDDPEAFTGMHARLLEWSDEGVVRGVTVRGIDRHADPTGYLATLHDRLRGADGDEPYVVVEKALLGDDAMPDAWPVAGTEGRDFKNAVGRLLVDPAGLARLGGAFRQFVGPSAPDAKLVPARARHVLNHDCSVELDRLAERLAELATTDLLGRDLPVADLRAALELVTSHLPVTRTYLTGGPVRDEDRAAIELAILRGRSAAVGLEPKAFDFLARVLFASTVFGGIGDSPTLRWVASWQQLCTEISRLGRHRSTLHLDAVFLSLSEPGGSPRLDADDLSIDAFHRFQAARAADSPLARSAVATLEDLRGEDVRARLHVLSEQPVRCARAFRRLARVHRSLKVRVGRRRAPDANSEWLIYQLLLGAWPFDDDGWAAALPSIEGHVRTLLAQVGPRPEDPEPRAFEEGTIQFLRALFGAVGAPFQRELAELRRIVQYFGALNSLTQSVLLATCPGVPEILEEGERWDFRLAGGVSAGGPDRSVRTATLAEVMEHDDDPVARRARIAGYVDSLLDGRIKAFVLSHALRLRREEPDLFAGGTYEPLVVRGARADHVCAFLRRRGSRCALVAVGRNLSNLTEPGTAPIGRGVWGDTTVELPDGLPSTWRETLSGVEIDGAGGVAVAELFSMLPQAICVGAKPGRHEARVARAQRRRRAQATAP